MTLWNLIRDFFVQNVFGGALSNGDYVTNNFIGEVFATTQGNEDAVIGTTTSPLVSIGQGNYPDFLSGGLVNENGTYLHIGLGDWLSTTFTIITLVLLVMFLYIFVKWIFKLFSGLLH